MCTTSRKVQLSTHDSNFSLLPVVITPHPPLLLVAELHLTALVVVATYQMNISFLASIATHRNMTIIVDKALVTKVSFTADKMHSSIAKICIYLAGEGRQQLAVHKIQTPFPAGS